MALGENKAKDWEEIKLRLMRKMTSFFMFASCSSAF